MQSHVDADGNLFLVADRSTMSEDLQRLDLAQARLLTELSGHWAQRVRYGWHTQKSSVKRRQGGGPDIGTTDLHPSLPSGAD